MKNKNVNLIRLVVFLAMTTGFFISSQSLASPYGFKKGTITGTFEGSYYYSKYNFGASGDAYPLPTENQFSEYRFYLGGSYDILNFLGVYSNLSFKRNRSLGLPIEHTNTGFSEWNLGSDVQVFSGVINIIPDLSITVPLHSKEPEDTAFLDDGAYKVTAILNISRQWFREFWTVGYFGYQYVDDLSSQLPYAFWIRHKLGVFFYQLGVNGQESMKNDSRSEGERFRVVSRNNAGSFIYRYYNSSYTMAEVKLGFQLGSWAPYVSLEAPVHGQYYSQGFRGLVGLTYSYTPVATIPKADPFKPDMTSK